MPFRYFPWGKYLPLDGSRAMLGDLNIADHNIFGSGSPNVLGFKDTTKKFLYGGYVAPTVYGAYMQMFGNACPAAGGYAMGSAEFVIDASHESAVRPFFSIWRCKYSGSWIKLFEILGGTVQKTISYLDFHFSTDALGPILIDRTTATKYRLYVDNGVLSIEAI